MLHRMLHWSCSASRARWRSPQLAASSEQRCGSEARHSARLRSSHNMAGSRSTRSAVSERNALRGLSDLERAVQPVRSSRWSVAAWPAASASSHSSVTDADPARDSCEKRGCDRRSSRRSDGATCVPLAAASTRCQHEQREPTLSSSSPSLLAPPGVSAATAAVSTRPAASKTWRAVGRARAVGETRERMRRRSCGAKALGCGGVAGHCAAAAARLLKGWRSIRSSSRPRSATSAARKGCADMLPPPSCKFWCWLRLTEPRRPSRS
mmetsp:Transcript_47193/g.154580  ORF Transcript_47193/g.154580 Transcript_47193/m.154580 type:complete len:266 (-) Transcript_47193:708-1505(-)